MQNIKNSAGELLDYSIHTPTNGSSDDLVLIGHGVTANKDREFLITLADHLAENGFEALRFSFSGNGQSEGDFRQSCPSKEKEDLKALIETFSSRNIVYIGHSMGGAVGVLALHDNARISRFVSLAGMVHTALFAEVEFGEVEPDSINGLMWEKPDCPLSSTFVEDMKKVDSVLPLSTQISVPWLIIHGTADDVVPVEHSRELKAAQPSIQLVEMDAVDHVFSESGWAIEMAKIVVNWLK